jgi:preprotein translocase subunit SecG
MCYKFLNKFLIIFFIVFLITTKNLIAHEYQDQELNLITHQAQKIITWAQRNNISHEQLLEYLKLELKQVLEEQRLSTAPTRSPLSTVKNVTATIVTLIIAVIIIIIAYKLFKKYSQKPWQSISLSAPPEQVPQEEITELQAQVTRIIHNGGDQRALTHILANFQSRYPGIQLNCAISYGRGIWQETTLNITHNNGVDAIESQSWTSGDSLKEVIKHWWGKFW